MRLGGPLFADYQSPEQWVNEVQALGYTAAVCPVDASVSDKDAEAYRQAAAAAGIVIAEVGAWSNPLSPDEKTAAQAVAFCQQQLALADKMGARCCVNIAGSRGEQWDGHHPDNLTDETFERIVTVVQTIIDAVNPTNTFYTLEPMPWMYPDSAESYLRLLAAVDRQRFAVHFDPVNMVVSPQRYYNNANLIQTCCRQLGRHIKSCHAKDILLSGQLTVHLDEVRPGLGHLDYRTFLIELEKLHPDTTLMLEHLPSADEYLHAATYIRGIAGELGITL